MFTIPAFTSLLHDYKKEVLDYQLFTRNWSVGKKIVLQWAVEVFENFKQKVLGIKKNGLFVMILEAYWKAQ